MVSCWEPGLIGTEPARPAAEAAIGTGSEGAWVWSLMLTTGPSGWPGAWGDWRGVGPGAADAGGGRGRQPVGVGQVQRDAADGDVVASGVHRGLDLGAGRGDVVQRRRERLAGPVTGGRLRVGAVVGLDVQAGGLDVRGGHALG